MTLRQWADDAFVEAVGRERRQDPVLPSTGGPAGNARLTAWTGTFLLVLFLVELATLIDVSGLISWHIVVGTLLVPPALLKTGSTGWRIVRYYTRREPYVTAGPPPMLLRVLGPLVVVFTLAVLGSGLALVAVGPVGGRTPFLRPLGYPVSALTVHQGTFVVWAVVTGIHTLGRLIPAYRIISRRGRTGEATPGRIPRAGALAIVLAVAGVAAAFVLGLSSAWSTGTAFHHTHDDRIAEHQHAGR
ncbi:MAG TPA: hypothetical protein VGL80_32605 [Pseudonocardiaceae bacterium]